MSDSLNERIRSRRRIYLLRHGEVSYFDPNGKPYRSHDVPLNPEGIAHAEAARDALRRVRIDLAVDTGLPRTRHTAEIVAAGRGLAVETVEALREVTPGPFAPDPKESIERYFTGAFGRGASRDERFLGGETFGAHADRVLPAFHALIARPGWKHLVVVAHGGTNRVILLHALGADLEGLARLEQDPGCINVLDVHDDGHLLVRTVNYTPYSPTKDEIWATTLEKIYLDHYAGAMRAREGKGP